MRKSGTLSVNHNAAKETAVASNAAIQTHFLPQTRGVLLTHKKEKEKMHFGHRIDRVAFDNIVQEMLNQATNVAKLSQSCRKARVTYLFSSFTPASPPCANCDLQRRTRSRLIRARRDVRGERTCSAGNYILTVSNAYNAQIIEAKILFQLTSATDGVL